MPTIPQYVVIFLAVIAAGISNWLQGDGLPRWKNALFAGGAFIVLSVFCMWLLGGFTGDLRTIVTYFIGLVVILGGNELVSLLKYLQAAPSPLLRFLRRRSGTRPASSDWRRLAK